MLGACTAKWGLLIQYFIRQRTYKESQFRYWSEAKFGKEKMVGCQASKENIGEDRSHWRGLVRGTVWGVARGMYP